MRIHILHRLNNGRFLPRFYPNYSCDPTKNAANQNQLFGTNIFNLKHTKYHNIRLIKQTIRQMIGWSAKNRTGGFLVNQERIGVKRGILDFLFAGQPTHRHIRAP